MVQDTCIWSHSWERWRNLPLSVPSLSFGGKM